MNLFYKCYTTLMGRRALAPVNTVLYRAALHGLGVMNVEARYSGEEWFLRQYLKLPEAPIMIDAGANVGEFSRLLKELYPRGRVHAFEPHPGNFKSLREVEEIESHNLALGSEECTIDLFDTNSAGSTFASAYSKVISEVHKTEAKAVPVKCTTLDLFCERNALTRVDFLKIDTEGYELNILQGSRQLLAGNAIQHILFEFNAMNTVSRVFMRDFRELLPQYKLYRLLPGGLLPLTEEVLLSEIFGFQNIYAELDA